MKNQVPQAFQDEIVFGTQYWRHPSPERRHWNRDMVRLREAGIDTVQLRLQWAWQERVEGRMLWKDLDDLFRITSKAGIRVVLKFMLETAPDWVYSKYKGHRVHPDETLFHPFSIAAMPVGGWLPCFVNPDVRKAACRYVKKVVGRYRNQKNLALWHAWNEVRSRPYGECACPHCLRYFSQWLKTKFKSIERLNDFTGKVYSSFETVRPPVVAGKDYVDTWLFRKFRATAVAANLDVIVGAIRKADDSRPVMAHVGISGPLQNILEDISDDRLSSQSVDFYGTSMITWTGTMRSFFDYDGKAILEEAGAAREMYLYALINRRLKSISPYFWNHEIYSDNWYYQLKSLTPENLEFQCMTTLAEGCKGMTFWQFHAERFSDESGNCGLLDLEGKHTPRSRWTKRFSTFLKKNGALLGAYQPSPARVALVYDQDSDIYSAAEDSNVHLIKDETYRYKESLKGFASLLFQSGVTFDLVDAEEKHDLSGYDLVIAPGMLVLTEASSAWLKKYVNGGGELWCEVDFGIRKSNGFMQPIWPSFGLDKAFGYRQTGTEHVSGTFPLSDAWKGVEAVDYRGDIKGKKDWFVQRKVGKGKVGMFRFMPGYSYRKKPQPRLLAAFDKLLRARALRPAYAQEGLYVREGSSGEKELLFVSNYTVPARSFKVPAGYKILAGGKGSPKKIQLDCGKWAVLIRSKS